MFVEKVKIKGFWFKVECELFFVLRESILLFLLLFSVLLVKIWAMIIVFVGVLFGKILYVPMLVRVYLFDLVG